MNQAERKQVVKAIVGRQGKAVKIVEQTFAKHGFAPFKFKAAGDCGGFLERSYDLAQGCRLKCTKELTIHDVNTDATVSVVLLDDTDSMISVLSCSCYASSDDWTYCPEAYWDSDSPVAQQFQEQEAVIIEDAANPIQRLPQQKALELLEMMCGFAASLRE